MPQATTEPITIAGIKARVEEIATLARDRNYPRAHHQEDALHRMVLAAIQAGAANPQELARAALRSRRIEFHRWYAER